jgi:hypothetical protein
MPDAAGLSASAVFSSFREGRIREVGADGGGGGCGAMTGFGSVSREKSSRKEYCSQGAAPSIVILSKSENSLFE